MSDAVQPELPNILLDDHDIDDMLDDLEAIEDGPVPKKKLSIEDDIPGEVDGMAEELVDLASKVPGGPPMSKHVLVNLMEDFKQAHKKKIRKGKFRGSERKREDFVKRLGEFLVVKLQASKKINRRTGQTTLGKKGKPVYMTISSLHTLGQRLKHLLGIVPLPRLDGMEKVEAEKEIDRIIETCIQVYNLAPSDRKYSTLYAVDLNRLIEKCYEFAEGKYDIAVQFHAMILILFYTGGRCGSILKTAHYPDEYLRWRQVRFVSFKDDEGVHKGFGVHLRLESFKGHHLKQDKRIKYKVPPVNDPRWLNLDLGTALLAHAFRGDFLGERTVEDLFDGTGFFGVEPEYEELPVIVARSSRMGLDWSRAMTDDAANPQLQDMMEKADIAFGTAGGDTLRSFRRGFATKFPDKDMGRYFMGHESNSTMLEDFYDESDEWVNLTDAMLGEGAGEELIVDPLSVLRVESEYPKVTLQSALEVCPEYRHLAAKKKMLVDCYRTGSIAWKKAYPFCELAKKRTLKYEDLPTFISKYTSDLRAVVRMVRQEAQADQLRHREIAQNMLEYATIKARREELKQPSDLALKLQGRLLAQERALLESEEEPEIEWDGEIDVPGVDDESEEIVVDVDADEEEEEEEAEAEEEDEEEEEEAEGGPSSATNARSKGKGRAVDGGPSGSQALDGTQSDETTRWVEDLVEAHSGDKVEQGGAPSQPLKSEIDVVEAKKSMLLTLIGLIDVSKAGPQPCLKCAADPFVTQAEKDKLHKPGYILARHYNSRHTAFGAAWGMMDSGKVSATRWECPVGKLRDVDCDFVIEPMYSGDGRKEHVLKKHKRHLERDIYDALHPDTMHIAKQAKHEGKARFGYNKKPEERLWLVNTDPMDLADRTFFSMPVEVSHETQHLPASLIGENGLLLL